MRSLVIVCLLGCSASPGTAPVVALSKQVAEVPPELACKVDDDCQLNELSMLVTNPDECVCPQCGGGPLNKQTVQARKDAFARHCKIEDHILNERKACPTSDCLYFDIGCREGQCVELPSRFGRPVPLPYTKKT